MKTHLITPTGLSPQQKANVDAKFRLLDELRGELSPDAARIQHALDFADPDDTIQLKGTFKCRSTDKLYLWKPVILEGVPSRVGATMQGGSWLMWGRQSDAEQTFKIHATIKNIRFDGFTGGAIRIAATEGNSVNTIQNCRFTEYKKGFSSEGKIPGAWPLVVGPGSSGPSTIEGTLEITGCFFGAPSYDKDLQGKPVAMNNLIHINNCNLEHLRITKNTIEDMSWLGIAVWGVTGRTEIADNHITIGNTLFTKFPGTSAGIAFGLRGKSYLMTRDGSVVIERNTVTVNSADSCGIVVGLYGDSQYLQDTAAPGAIRDVVIRDNVVRMNKVGNKRAALACVGACSHSTWASNVVTGSAPYGILVSQDTGERPVSTNAEDRFIRQASASPSNNTFQDNALAGGATIDPTTRKKHIDPKTGKVVPFDKFTASQAQAFVDASVTYLDLLQNAFGEVSGANDWPPPIVEPRAGIVYWGSYGSLNWNHFSSSGIQGWPLPPKPGELQMFVLSDPHIGCIYLAQESSRNQITYSPTNFPDATVPPRERQILDLATSVWGPGIWIVGTENTITEMAEPTPVKHEPPERPRRKRTHRLVPTARRTVKAPVERVGPKLGN